MILVGVGTFIQETERYVSLALDGEPIEIISRNGKTLRLGLKEEEE